MNEEPPSKKNGTTRVLNTLAGSQDRWVQLGTMALVAISGFTSFFQTEHLSKQSYEDRDKAIREIHHLYERTDGFQNRQVEALRNQQQLLENQREILEVIRKNQEQLLRR